MDEIQMLLPVRGLDPLLRNLTQQTAAQVADDQDEERWVAHVDWNTAYDNVRVPITAQWSELSIMARDLLKLKEGDIIPLDPNRLGQVEMRLGGDTKFVGRLGSLDDKAAVQINERFKH